MTHRHIYFDGTKSIALDRWQASEWRNLFGDYFGAGGVNEYYATVSFLFRCVTIRAGAVSSLPWRLLDSRGEVIATHDDVADMAWLNDLPELMNLAESALCLSSRAYFYKERNRRNRVLGLKWWSPVAVEPVWDTYQGLLGFRRHVAGSHLYAPDSLVWLHLPNPLHETEPGVSPAQAAATDAGVLYSTDAFTKAFFDRGAIRATLLTVDGNPSPDDRERLKSWWSRAVSGITNAFTTEVFSSAVNPVQVGEGVQELSNTALTTEKREGICAALGVPLSLVMANAANYATAQVDERGFYTRTVIPAAQMIERRLNRQLFAEMDLRFQFTPQMLDIFREDEEQRSTAFANYVAAGMKPSVAAEMLGLDLPVEYAELDPQPVEVDGQVAADGKTLSDRIFGYHIEEGVVMRDEVRASLGLGPLSKDTLGDIEAKLKAAGEAMKLGIPAETAFGIVGLDTGVLAGQIDADDQAEEASNQPVQTEPATEEDPADDEDIQAEAAKFRRWLKKNPKRSPSKFSADYLSDADKHEIYIEATGAVDGEVKAMVLPGAEDGNDAARNELEQKHTERISKAFRSVVRAIVPTGTTTENITPEMGVQRLRDNFQPVRDAITTMVLEAGQLGVDTGIAQVETLMGVRKASVGGVDWDLANQAVIDWVLGGAPGLGEGYGDIVTQAMVQSREEFIRSSIAEWIQNGEPLNVLTEQLGRSFFSRDRAEMISISEVTRAYAEGNRAAWRESGIIQRMRWETSADERVCSLCGPKHGEIADVNGEFADGTFPFLHPRCRCWITPVVDASRAQRPTSSDGQFSPSGTIISESLTGVPKRGKMAPPLQDAAAAIDGVHGDGELIPVSVKTGKMTSRHGHYKYTLDGKPVEIKVSTISEHPRTTMAHEVGHYLERPLSDALTANGEDRIERVREWLNVVERTDAYQELTKLRSGEKKISHTWVDGTTREYTADRNHVRYLMQSNELWARSYAQYITTKSGNPEMLRELNEQIANNQYASQWTHEDFAPVSAAMDKLFLAARWITDGS